jgi:heavy metal-binding protein
MLRSTFLCLPLWLALSLLAGACRAPSIPHPATPGCHPACAGAREGVVGDAGALLRGAEVSSAPAAERAPSAAAYLCPMHLHLGSDEPGRCPECNMRLVPRAQALEHDHGS